MIRIITHPDCVQYHREGHPERPQRIKKTVEKLKSQKELKLQWEEPLVVDNAAILRAHTAAHLKRIPQGVDFDADTPAYPNIDAHARHAVGGALLALKFAMKGENAFSLLRPPGHHAERDRAMGFCYFNQAAISAMEAREQGFKKVAVFDFDIHHGNGTEDILHNAEGFSFYSIHQFPCYPGTGQKSFDNIYNYPVLPHTPRTEYRKIISKALEDMKAGKPDLIVVSAGFDAYARDPLAQGTLEAEDFHWIGKSIREFNIPFFSVLEGGYSDDLPELIFAYLKGTEGEK